SFPSPKAYREALNAKGLSPRDIERDTRKTLAVNRLLQDAVWKSVKVDDAAVRSFYTENLEQFRHPPEIRASHILVHVPAEASPADRAAARTKAEALDRRVRAGEDFAALAQAASDDPATKKRGGDLGYFARGTMVESFESAAFNQK